MPFTDLGMTKHEELAPGRSGVRSSGLDLFKLMRCPGVWEGESSGSRLELDTGA